mmetsp:Transcript_24665/g.36337  ORF Transcript_24665/g.36337 Transcript_24665/m.36337 type:complete len:1874 (-) Transcript_24665:159-5780(-)
MDSGDTAIVDLDALTAKQRAKEFKTTAKEVKTKDPAKKNHALEKIKDERYLLEGGCLTPLLESLVPKKKTLQLCKLTLESLLTFLNKKDSTGLKLCLHGTEALFSSSGSLNVLQNLSEIMMYEEEVKKKKKKNSEPTPEEILGESLRFYAIQGMSLFAYAVYNMEPRNHDIATAFASIPDIVLTSCRALKYLSARLDNEETKERIIDACVWVMQILLVVLRYGSDSISVFLSVDGVLELAQKLCREERLSLHCMLLFEYLSTQPAGLQIISTQEYIELVLSVLEEASERIVSDPIQGKAPTGKGKDTKGSVKAQEQVNSPRSNAYRDISLVRTAVMICVALAQNAKASVSTDSVSRVMEAVIAVAQNPHVWAACEDVQPSRPDPDVSNFIRDVSMLMGCYGLISEDIRICAAEKGAVRFLLNLMSNSTLVAGIEKPEPPTKKGKEDSPRGDIIIPPEKLEVLYALRHVIEKALLHLLTDRVVCDTDIEGSDGNTQSGENISSPKICSDRLESRCSMRCQSYKNYKLDLRALASNLEVSNEATQATNISLIVDFIKHADVDLSNRGARLLNIIMQSCADEDIVSFLQSQQVDSTALANLSLVSVKRAVAAANCVDSSVLSATKEFVTKAEIREELSTIDPVENCEPLEGAEEVKDSELEGLSAPEVIDEPSDSLILKMDPLQPCDSLCHILCCIEYLLDVSPSYISVFATEDQVTAFAGLLYRCGPVCGKYLDENEASMTEFHVTIQDPRDFSWSMEQEAEPVDKIILREISFDILAVVAASDAKYRDYGDGELPQQPLTPFPSSSCSCADEAARVIRLCANPCVATVSCCSSLKLEDDNILACPLSHNLSEPVCNAALRLLASMASAGVRGLDIFYKAIAQYGFANDDSADKSFVPAMIHMKDFLSHKVLPLQPIDNDSISLEAIDAPFSWDFPTLCNLDKLHGKTVTNAYKILYMKEYWPFIAVAGAILGVLANPTTRKPTMTIALSAVSGLSRVPTVSDVIQPAVVDIFSACVLSLGGAVIIGGSMGRFGPLGDVQWGQDVLMYIFNRGMVREKYWNDIAKQKNVDIPDETQKLKAKKPTSGGKDKGKDGKKKGVEDELSLPFEPDLTHSDPNHGPDTSTWSAFINTSCDDLHSKALRAQPLTACIQGGHTALAIALIAVGADINRGDSMGVTPLDHCLILGNEEVAAALVAAGVYIDQLDMEGNPSIKYAFFSLSPEDRSFMFQMCNAENHTDRIDLSGGEFFIQSLIAAGVDLNVSDSECGNYPLHYSIGLGCIVYSIGGVVATIKSNVQAKEGRTPVETIERLVAAGAPINSPNKNGVTALHVLAGLGDKMAVMSALKLGAVANALDNKGFSPLHYLAATCPENCVEVGQSLVDHSVRRPKQRMEYSDVRTGKTREEKYDIDARRVLDNAMANALCPSSVKYIRMTLADILMLRSDDGISPATLCLCGDVLDTAPQHRCLTEIPTSTPERRFEFFKFLCDMYDGDFYDLIRNVDCNEKINPAVATALFFASASRNKDVSLDSIFELVLPCFRKCFADESFSCDYTCEVAILKLDLPKIFTILHVAIVSNYAKLVDIIWEKGVTIYKFPYAHYVAGLSNVSDDIVQGVVSRASKTPVHGSLLNASVKIYPDRPLHRAVSAKNIAYMRRALSIPQVDPNVTDDISGKTALHLAIDGNDVDTVNVFVECAEELNILIEDNNGDTCVEAALLQEDTTVLNLLLSANKADVIERLLLCKGETDSLLMKLERENIKICNELGIQEQSEHACDGDVMNSKEENVEDVVNIEGADADDVVDNATPPEEVPAGSHVREEESTKVSANADDLERNSAFLLPLIRALKELDIAGPDVHAHQCFADGLLYQQYCTNATVE